MNTVVCIKPEYRKSLAHLPIDVNAQFEVLAHGAHDTFIVWQSWQPHRQCFVLNRCEVDIA